MVSGEEFLIYYTAVDEGSISSQSAGNLWELCLPNHRPFAVEEAIGRFYENIIGRSKGFWQYIYEPLTDILPQLKTYTPQDLFEAVNHAQPSLIRLEADELTYLLHIHYPDMSWKRI